MRKYFIVVRACGYGECSLIMISPLLLEGRKEQFMTMVESNVRAAQKQIRLTLRTIYISQPQDLRFRC